MGNDQAKGGGGGGGAPRTAAAATSQAAAASQELAKKLQLLEKRCVGVCVCGCGLCRGAAGTVLAGAMAPSRATARRRGAAVLYVLPVHCAVLCLGWACAGGLVVLCACAPPRPPWQHLMVQSFVLVPRRTRTYVRTHSREAHLQKQIEQLTAQAREKKKKGDKNGALFCLKKRKMLQGQQEKLSAARLNLETMQLTIGSAKYVGPCPVCQTVAVCAACSRAQACGMCACWAAERARALALAVALQLLCSWHASDEVFRIAPFAVTHLRSPA